MGCCGKNTEKIKKVQAIIKGTARSLQPDKMADRRPWSDAAKKRVEICRRCPDITFLTLPRYIYILRSHGIKKVISNITDLTVIPKLPIVKFRPSAHPYCSECKCNLKGKVTLEDEKCPIGKW